MLTTARFRVLLASCIDRGIMRVPWVQVSLVTLRRLQSPQVGAGGAIRTRRRTQTICAASSWASGFFRLGSNPRGPDFNLEGSAQQG